MIKSIQIIMFSISYIANNYEKNLQKSLTNRVYVVVLNVELLLVVRTKSKLRPHKTGNGKKPDSTRRENSRHLQVTA